VTAAGAAAAGAAAVGAAAVGATAVGAAAPASTPELTDLAQADQYILEKLRSAPEELMFLEAPRPEDLAAGARVYRTFIEVDASSEYSQTAKSEYSQTDAERYADLQVLEQLRTNPSELTFRQAPRPEDLAAGARVYKTIIEVEGSEYETQSGYGEGSRFSGD